MAAMVRAALKLCGGPDGNRNRIFQGTLSRSTLIQPGALPLELQADYQSDTPVPQEDSIHSRSDGFVRGIIPHFTVP